MVDYTSTFNIRPCTFLEYYRSYDKNRARTAVTATVDSEEYFWGATHAGGPNHRESGMFSNAAGQRARHCATGHLPQGVASLNPTVPVQAGPSLASSLHPSSGRTVSALGGPTGASRVRGPTETSPAVDDTNLYGTWSTVLRQGGLSSRGRVKGGRLIGIGT